MAEHMFGKYKQVSTTPSPDTAEDIADLFYEIGRQALEKRNYRTAVKWLERSFDILEGQQLSSLSSGAGELKLCVMQGLGKSIYLSISALLTVVAVQAHMELKLTDATDRAWQLVKLMEADYGDKMVVSLLKIELLSAAEHIDEAEYYHGELSTSIEKYADHGSSCSNDPKHSA